MAKYEIIKNKPYKKTMLLNNNVYNIIMFN